MRKCLYGNITIKPREYAKKVEIIGNDKESDKWKCKFHARYGVGDDVYVDLII